MISIPRLPAVATCLTLALTLAVGHAPQATAAPVSTVERVTLPGTGTITIAGRGYGHGRGMSQYGARAAASQGVGYQQILDFYYPGTTSVAQADEPIRVLISADSDNDVRILAVPGMTASDSVNRNTPIGFPGQTVTQWRITRSGSGLYLDGLVGGSWKRWSQGASPGFLSIAAPSGFIRLIGPTGTQKDYRGTVRAVIDGASPRIRTVNEVRMDDYLRSVVPAESPSSWPADALRAQSVAARTYASFERAQAPGAAWHTCDTTQCQVYAGHKSFTSAGVQTALHEAATTDAAITSTANQVRHSGGRPAFTQFSASNGGWTAAGSQPYLVARADPWDGTGNPVHRWSVKLTAAQLRSAFPSVGTVRSITVQSRTGNGEWGGRVERVVVAGSTGSTTVTGSAFRSALGLRSDWWKLTASSRIDSDFTADGRPDLLAQIPGGGLRAYEGNGTGGFLRQTTVGSGWSGMRLVIRAGDLTGSGNPDVLAVSAQGTLYRYPSDGAGRFGPRSVVGPGWSSMSTILAPGDVDRDGDADLLAIDTSGSMWLYPGNGTGGFGARRFVGPGWSSMTAVLGAGDWNGDGTADLLARSQTGDLLLYRGNGTGGFSPVRIGNGWSGMRLLLPVDDWDGDGVPDLLASDSTGRMYLYPWSGSSFQARRQVGTGWSSIERIF